MKTWCNRPILDKGHYDDLEALAAVHELQHGMPRADAEERAYTDYRRGHALDAAAHHLLGIRAAYAAGASDAAHQHGQMYASAMREAGLDPFAPPPKEVVVRFEKLQNDVYAYRAHAADEFFQPAETAADDDDARLEDALARVLALRASLK